MFHVEQSNTGTMQLYSTNNPELQSNFKTALFTGMPPDKGLYLPVNIPIMPTAFVYNLANYSFKDIAFSLAQAFLYDEIPPDDLREIIQESIQFEAPLIALDESTYVQELFHGPSFAFKDFGARFMAHTMAYFNRMEKKPITILVATSGDTGGAVASGFLNAPGIQVVILYPSGKISNLQEKQITTLGNNITAIEVNGSFDDCQALVKMAFMDPALGSNLRLSTANSINFARLLPQTFYYWEAYKQISHMRRPVVFSIPSGNFGNLTAGLLAQKMGLPIHQFVVATNANDVMSEYLDTGIFRPRASRQTLSSAMDVGNPSNFPRVLELCGSTWNIMRETMYAYRFSDAETRAVMRETYSRFNYIFEPHGAVGYLAWRTYQKNNPETLGIILETAHPAKFKETVDRILSQSIPVPKTLQLLLHKPKSAIYLEPDYSTFRHWLIHNCQ